MPNKQQNMAMVVQAFRNAGLSENQARIIAAEVGRENGYQDQYLWGYHSDPANKATNVGMLSWQGNRGRQLQAALQNAGLLKDGKIAKNQESLDLMAQFAVNEMRTNPEYAKTRQQFLDNPDVDYNTGNSVLGRNYIRWRYDDPKYVSGHRQRDNYYQQLGGVVTNPGGDTPQYDFAKLDNFNGYMDNLASKFGGNVNVLGGSVGLSVPQTQAQNEIYGRIAAQALPNDLEAAYGEAGRALADVRDDIATQPMLRGPSPLRGDIEYIFDSIDIPDASISTT